MERDGWWLGIELSNPSAGRGGGNDNGGAASVALGRLAGGAFSDVREEALRGKRADDDLMPAVARVCAAAGVGAGDLRGVAVSAGPGGFTSLRVSVTAARFIALGAGAGRGSAAMVVPVPSWLSAVWGARVALPSVVCLASKDERAWGVLLAADEAGAANAGAGAPRRVEAGALGEVWAGEIGMLDAGRLGAIGPASVVADQFLPASLAAWADGAGVGVVRPAFSARSVLEASVRLDAVEAMALAPVYPREPDAVTQWRLRHGG